MKIKTEKQLKRYAGKVASQIFKQYTADEIVFGNVNDPVLLKKEISGGWFTRMVIVFITHQHMQKRGLAIWFIYAVQKIKFYSLYQLSTGMNNAETETH